MGFSPGTAGYGQDQERRFRHQTQRNINVADMLLGLGTIAQQLGAVRRSRQEDADEQQTLAAMGQMQGGPEAQQGPNPSPQGIGGVSTSGAMANGMPAPQQQRTSPNYAQMASEQTPAGYLERFGQLFGAPVRGRLRAGPAMALQGMQDKRASDASEAAYRSEQIRVQNRQAGAAEMQAQAAMDAASTRENDKAGAELNDLLGQIASAKADRAKTGIDPFMAGAATDYFKKGGQDAYASSVQRLMPGPARDAEINARIAPLEARARQIARNMGLDYDQLVASPGGASTAPGVASPDGSIQSDEDAFYAKYMAEKHPGKSVRDLTPDERAKAISAWEALSGSGVR